MNDTLFAQCDQLLDEGAAPGGVIALIPPGGYRPELHPHGIYAGQGSTAVAIDTVYDIASVTKLFTTALVIRLHEQGKLSINDPCAIYLPNFHSSNLRLVDLLTHHVSFGISLSRYSAQFPSVASLQQALLALPPPAEPTTTVNYANLQMFYLGVIVEHVSGQPLADAIHSLCQKLGLTHTYTGGDSSVWQRSIPPTERIDEQIVQGITHDESARALGGLAGHAGIFSTAGDLALFGQAWLDGRIVRRELSRDMVFRNYDTSGESPQGLGWWRRFTSLTGSVPTQTVYLQGGFTGAFLAVNPTAGSVAALVCNRTYYGRDNTKHRLIWQQLVTWLQS